MHVQSQEKCVSSPLSSSSSSLSSLTAHNICLLHWHQCMKHEIDTRCRHHETAMHHHEGTASKGKVTSDSDAQNHLSLIQNVVAGHGAIHGTVLNDFLYCSSSSINDDDDDDDDLHEIPCIGVVTGIVNSIASHDNNGDISDLDSSLDDNNISHNFAFDALLIDTDLEIDWIRYKKKQLQSALAVVKCQTSVNKG
jgi:hypothetical protein